MKKIRKGKILAGGLFALAGIAVGGVGFSSWVVQINQDKTLSDITVTVADTSDLSIKIFYAEVSDKLIEFDGKTVTDADPRLTWSKDNDQDKGEDLSFAIKYYVATTAAKNVDKITATFTMNPSWFGNYVTNDYNAGSASDKLYVVAPFGSTPETNVLELVGETTTGTGENQTTKYMQAKSEDYATDHNKFTSTVTEKTEAEINTLSLKVDEQAVVTPVFTGEGGYKYYEITTTFRFDWSAKVDHKNPVEYVKDNSSLTDEQVQTLANDLADLKGALNEKKFNILLTPVANS